MASKKCTNIYIPKYFMAVRNFIKKNVLLEVVSLVWSRETGSAVRSLPRQPAHLHTQAKLNHIALSMFSLEMFSCQKKKGFR